MVIASPSGSRAERATLPVVYTGVYKGGRYNSITSEGFRWLLAGGIFYTAGILFFVLDHWYPWCHGVWHLFVLAGSVSHYLTILLSL